MISKRNLLRMLERERAAATAREAQLIATICELAHEPQASPIPRPVVERKRDPNDGGHEELVEL